jgi:DNA polymerase-3 subunit delta'
MPDFSEIYGNRAVIQNLTNAMNYNRVAHCYMLVGARGLGKHMVAKAFAKALQCEGEGRRPCGVCASCKQVEHENHPDVVYVRHEKPTVFGVDDIREGLNHSIVIKPYKAEKKIYILEDGELLNAQAQNAMLKTIEEPPSYGVILILTDNGEGFLPTIKSRCVELSLQLVSDEDLVKCLKHRGFELGDQEEQVVRFAAGNIGRAIAYLENEQYRQMMKDIQEVLRTLPEADSMQVKQDVELLSAYKEQMPLVLEQMRRWFRDVYLCKAGSAAFRESAYQWMMQQQTELYAYEDLQRILREMEQFQNRLKVNVNLELSMELMLMKLQPGK